MKGFDSQDGDFSFELSIHEMFLIALYVVAGMVCLCTVMKDFGPKG